MHFIKMWDEINIELCGVSTEVYSYKLFKYLNFELHKMVIHIRFGLI